METTNKGKVRTMKANPFYTMSDDSKAIKRIENSLKIKKGQTPKPKGKKYTPEQFNKFLDQLAKVQGVSRRKNG